jgi:hypothetical protein
MKNGGKKKSLKKQLGAVYNVDTQGLFVPIMTLTITGIVAGGIWYFGRLRRNAQKARVLDHITEEGTSSNIAERLRRAIGSGWDGTDENEVLQAISEVKSQNQWESVEKDFLKLTGANLNDRLSSELSNTLWERVQAMLNLKPNRQGQDTSPENARVIVRMLIDALDYTAAITFYQNDVDIENVITAMLMIADKAQYELVKKIFYEQYGMELWQALESEAKLTMTWFISLIDYFSNTYAGNGGAYIDIIKENIIRRFGAL